MGAADQRFGVGRRRVVLGVNYPQYENWLGLYFGPNHRINPTQVPANVDDVANARWRSDFRDLLKHYGEMGLSVVRVFLLGNAWNYGRGQGATFESPDPARDPRFWRESVAAYERHLCWMLESAASANIKLLPSLLSFVAFFTAGDGSGGRGAIITNPRDRGLFLELFRVLLAASARHRDAIFAWEMINEPVWVTRTLLSRAASSLPWPLPRLWNGAPCVPHREMVRFLAEGVAAIASFGFDYTVGHNFERSHSILGVKWSDDATFPVPAAVSTATGAGEYLPQFHYYPDGFTRRALRPYRETRAFLGEISCRPPADRSREPDRWPWPELLRADGPSAREAVFRRLCWVERCGYAMALLWPDGEHRSGTRSLLSASAEAGIDDYLRLANPYS